MRALLPFLLAVCALNLVGQFVDGDAQQKILCAVRFWGAFVASLLIVQTRKTEDK